MNGMDKAARRMDSRCDSSVTSMVYGAKSKGPWPPASASMMKTKVAIMAKRAC